MQSHKHIVSYFDTLFKKICNHYNKYSFLCYSYLGDSMKEFLEKNFDFKKLLKSFLVIYLFFYRSIFSLIPMLLFGLDLKNASNQIIGVINLYIGLAFALLVIFIYYKNLVNEMKKFIKKFKSNFKIGLKSWSLGLAIMYVSNLILLIVFHSEGANNETAVQTLIKASPIAMGFYTCLIAPFVEEIVFRKTLKDFFKSKWLFVFISFLFFGCVHVLPMANNFLDLLYIVPYGAMGATFAYAYYKTDTVYTSVLFHIIHNSILFFISILL